MLKDRLIMASVLILVVIGLIFFAPAWGFSTALFALIALAAWEWAGLIWPEQKPRTLASVSLIAMCTAGLLMLNMGHVLLLSAVLWLTVPGVLWAFEKGYLTQLPKSLRLMVAAIILISTLMSVQMLEQFNPMRLLSVLLLIWITDSAAYFIGRAFGTHRLMPKTSPGKTLEGFIGGCFASAILGAMLYWVGNAPAWPSVNIAILQAVLIALYAVLGDLYESLLKRLAGVKDSGCLLPGHGGVLDRIDSLLAAAPVAAVSLLFTG